MFNLTLPVPDGTETHDVPGLICTPTTWSDYVVFFGANYAAHAFTIIHPPGASVREKAISCVLAFFIPGAGIMNSARWIFACAIFYRADKLRMAARSGALCMVLKNCNAGFSCGKWDPWMKRVFYDGVFRLVPADRSVYGTFSFAGRGSDYVLVEVPLEMPLELLSYIRTIERSALDQRQVAAGNATKTDCGGNDEESVTIPEYQQGDGGGEVRENYSRKNINLPYSWNMVQLLVSLFQSLYGSYTLYNARGNQVDMYGFSAFGLTVAPYALMSSINIIALLLTPQYPSMYLVLTPDGEALRISGGDCTGAIAVVGIPEEQVYANSSNSSSSDIYYLACMGLIFTPIAIVGGMSRFRFGAPSSSLSQRIWISTWLFTNVTSSLWLKFVNSILFGRHLARGTGGFWMLVWLALVVPLFIPAIGGMLHVGYMLKSYGSCWEIGL